MIHSAYVLGPILQVPVSRRGALVALVGLGGPGLFGQPATAWQKARPWKNDVDADGHSLFDLGSLATTDNSTVITDFAGDNLSIDGNGILNATDTDTDTRTNVSDDSTRVVTNTEDINFASKLSVSDDSNGSVTVDATGGTSGVGASVFLTSELKTQMDQLTTVAYDQELYDDDSGVRHGHACVHARCLWHLPRRIGLRLEATLRCTSATSSAHGFRIS